VVLIPALMRLIAARRVRVDQPAIAVVTS